MDMTDQAWASSNCLLVTDNNLLDDSLVAAGHRDLLNGLAGVGMSTAAICRFVVPGEQETEPEPWLNERGWNVEENVGSTVKTSIADHVPITLFKETSTRPHGSDELDRTSFMQVVIATLDEKRPDVLIAQSGPSLAEILTAGHAHDIPTVVLQTDCSIREPGPLKDADLILTPTRFAAEYLREAFGLPCAHLPPIVAQDEMDAEKAESGAIALDGSDPACCFPLYAQVIDELSRRRPEIPIVLIGSSGPASAFSKGKVESVPLHPLGKLWSSVRILLAPMLAWERLPLTALSAIRHGVPAIVSDRGPAVELFDGAALMLPLPQRLTSAVGSLLQPDELAPWLETLVRLHDDRAFAGRQHTMALVTGQRWSAQKLAPHYAHLMYSLAHSRRHYHLGNGNMQPSRNGSAKAVQRLAEEFAWPQERPPDAAPGKERGWLGGGTEQMLAQALSPKTHLVVELGAWLGMSTRFIANHAPEAVVISVDHWKGSTEHQQPEQYKNLLPHLYETFLSRCWDYRDRVVPLRMDTRTGLRTVAEHGLEPDFIYVDAEHTYESVTADLTLARSLFPKSALGGDDYDWSGVREAVDGFARRNGMVVERVGWRGWRLLEAWQASEALRPPPARTQSVVLVPHMNGIEWECEQALQRLEHAGVRVVRRAGCSAIDVARNELLSNALHDGADAMLFIDSDVGFDPSDALRLLARPEPVVSGVYAKKGVRELASIFAEGVKEILFGPDAVGPYPLKYAATGFLRVRAGVLRQMIAELRLPLCNTHWGKGIWPFFLPQIVPHGPGKVHYLGEDWSFSYRLNQIGVTPLADTSIRLWHWGRYSFSWEDAGSTVQRYRSYNYKLVNA